jgi:hypothetical protein
MLYMMERKREKRAFRYKDRHLFETPRSYHAARLGGHIHLIWPLFP